MLRRLVATLLFALLAPLTAQAQSFTDSDRHEIETWFRIARQAMAVEDTHKGKRKGPPPGLAKRDSLPPGLAKRDTLPPGLARRDLPNDLERRLSRLPRGTRRSLVGDDIVLIEEATGLVIDILRGLGR